MLATGTIFDGKRVESVLGKTAVWDNSTKDPAKGVLDVSTSTSNSKHSRLCVHMPLSMTEISGNLQGIHAVLFSKHLRSLFYRGVVGLSSLPTAVHRYHRSVLSPINGVDAF